MLIARKAVVAAVIALTAITLYVVARFYAQDDIQSADFRNAATAEIRDSTGKVVLGGSFKLVEEEDDDIERKAALVPTAGSEAMGEAEVEYATEMPADQEVEFAARGLAAGTAYTLIVDGREVATVTADARGRIAVEINVPLPGALR